MRSSQPWMNLRLHLAQIYALSSSLTAAVGLSDPQRRCRRLSVGLDFAPAIT
jgi:hypothetical protein